jgi:thiol-disulfide isomerase/thioredoxin
MNIKTIFTALLLTISSVWPAQSNEINQFVPGSYQQLLNDYAGKAFVLVLWSVDCPSCLKDMELLRSFRGEHPEINLVMMSTDEASAVPQVQKLLQDHQLADLPNWVFADEDAQKLRYEIDQNWFGELPRTYFFSQDHKRVGKSGALTKQQLLEFSKP